MPTGAQLHPKLVVDSRLLLSMSIQSQNINVYLTVSCRAICRGFAAICCRNSDLADLAHNYRGGPRPDCLIGVGNDLYWSCLMTDHEHENQTCPFGELNLGVGLPNWGKTQMQHDNPHVNSCAYFSYTKSWYYVIWLCVRYTLSSHTDGY